MARIRCGRLDRLRMCRSAARLSCSLLRAGSLRGSACFRSAFTPSSGFSCVPWQGALPSLVEIQAGELSLLPEALGADQEVTNGLKHPEKKAP
jgi:hypothetical protein